MELTKKEIGERLLVTAKGAENWDEVMTSVALIRAAVREMQPVDDGQGREALENFAHSLPTGLAADEVRYRIDQRARQQEREDLAATVARLTAALNKAQRALIRAGFQDRGGQEWVPPLGNDAATRDGAYERAALVCDAKFLARVESGHPREASAARALSEEIRALKIGAPAAPAPQTVVAPAGMRITLHGNSHPVEVFAEPCLVGEFAPHRFALHHTLWDDMLNPSHFSVTHIDTGWRVGRGDSPEEALDDARENLASVSRDEFDKRCADAKNGIAPPIGRVVLSTNEESEQ